MNDYKFVLTKSTVTNAKTYMPIADKESLAKSIAKSCLEDMPTADQNKEGEKYLALPYLRTVNYTSLSILTLYIFVTKYLGLKWDAEKDEAEYNKYASSHIFNQLERFKQDPQLKDKVFDILADYREFEKMVKSEVYALKELNNDVLARFTAAIQVMSTPENIQAMIGEFKKAGKEYTDILRDKKIIGQQKRINAEKAVNNG